ncbi:MAG: hypothetical protein JWM05_3273, partial [Acidimicrobiales bacterium]|nr:hypothetical protein [Acidimicrobiales bacterium]
MSGRSAATTTAGAPMTPMWATVSSGRHEARCLVGPRRHRQGSLGHRVVSAVSALVVSIVVISLLAPTATAADTAEACSPSDSSITIRWVGTSADARWSNEANWVDRDSHARLPGPSDIVCIDTSLSAAGIVVDVSATVDYLRLLGGPTAPTLHVRSALTGTNGLHLGAPVSLEGGGPTTPALRVVSETYPRLLVLAPLTVASGAGAALISAGWIDLGYMPGPAPGLSITLEADTTIRGEFWQVAPLTVKAGVHVHYSRFSPSLQWSGVWIWRGPLTIEAGGSFVNDGPIFVAIGPAARQDGLAPTLTDVALSDVGPTPFPIIAAGDTSIDGIEQGADVRLLPAADGHLSLTGAWNAGAPPTTTHLDVSGQLTMHGTSTRLAPATVAGGLLVQNTGTLDLQHVTATARLDNHGRFEAGGNVSITQPDGSTQPHTNSGAIALHPTLATDRLTFFGDLQNDGTIDGAAPGIGAGHLTVTDGTLSGTGTIGVPVELNNSSLDTAGRHDVTLPRLATASTSHLVFDVVGLAETDSDHLDLAEASTLGGATVDLRPASGYIVCAGDRWRVVRGPTGGNGPVNAVVANGARAARTVTTFDGVEVVATADSSSTCSDSLRRRFVAGVFVEGLGRQAPAGTLDRLSGASAGQANPSPTERANVARPLLSTAEGRHRAVETEYQRLVHLSPNAAGAAYWADRLRSTGNLNALRATLEGSTARRTRTGGTDSAWITAMYQDELDRNPSAAERTRAASALRDGASRVSVAAPVITSAEGRQARVTRWAAHAWGHPPSSDQRTWWATALRSGTPE